MEEISIDASEYLLKTHCFVYKGKQYHFDIDLFKKFSQYFNLNKPQVEQNNNITIYDEPDNNLILSDSLINDFINFCQAKQIKLTQTNASSLHKLAQKFKVPSLIKVTTKFMEQHQKDFIIDILLLRQKDCNSSTDEYEEIISNDLIHYTDDKRLLSLPIPVLYRIMTKYAFKNKLSIENHEDGEESNEEQKIIDFLFACLDEYGIRASPLFEHIKINTTIINRLIKSYKDKFDFNYIKDEQIKSIHKTESNRIYEYEKLKNELFEKTREIEELRREQKEEKKKIEEMTAAFTEREQQKDLQMNQIYSEMQQMRKEILSLKNEIEQKITPKENEMKSENERLQTEVQQLRNEITSLRSDIETRISSHNNETSGRIDEVRREIDEIHVTQRDSSNQITNANEIIDHLIKKWQVRKVFVNDSNPGGIISW